jgi:hypothetical protein
MPLYTLEKSKQNLGFIRLQWIVQMLNPPGRKMWVSKKAPKMCKLPVFELWPAYADYILAGALEVFTG